MASTLANAAAAGSVTTFSPDEIEFMAEDELVFIVPNFKYGEGCGGLAGSAAEGDGAPLGPLPLFSCSRPPCGAFISS